MLLGFDIGGTKCAIVIGEKNRDGHLLIRAKKVIATDRPVYEMIELLYSTAEDLLAVHQIAAPEGIGISCGGPLNSKKGIITAPPNLPGWLNIPIVKLTQARFNVAKVVLQNDANACAVAEWKYGAGKGTSNLVFLTCGTGMGAGLVLNGALYAGTCDLAGEVGHMRLADMGPVGFGKSGSFEGFCSGGGIAQLGQQFAREQLQVGRPVAYCNSIDELQGVTARSIAEAAFAGDETALRTYEVSGHFLGKAIALLIDILNPEIIVIGSIYGRASDLLQPAMDKVLRAEAIGESLDCCRIVPAGLGENIGDIAALSLAEM